MNKYLERNETVTGTTQTIEAYISQGFKVLGRETIHDTTVFDGFKPKGTKRAIVIYFG